MLKEKDDKSLTVLWTIFGTLVTDILQIYDIVSAQEGDVGASFITQLNK